MTPALPQGYGKLVRARGVFPQEGDPQVLLAQLAASSIQLAIGRWKAHPDDVEYTHAETLLDKIIVEGL